jgi:preprotein translocase subunit SecE
MLILQLQKILTTPITQTNRQNKSRFSVIFWYSLSLTFAISYILLGLRKAFSRQYIVSDDAREYISWMYRYFNPDLFPGDLIADYFQSVTPIGYGIFYKIIAALNIDLILFSKIFPIVLGIITTSYCFAVCMEILPVPMVGFIASLLLNQSLCLQDDLFSATPRDFIYPLFLAFLYYLIRSSKFGILIVVLLQASIYPLIAFIEILILFMRLFSWQNRQITISHNRKDLILFAASIVIAGTVILTYAIQSSQFGPTITAAVARTMPEYWDGGRFRYFSHNIISYWFDGRDSGFFALISPPQLLLGLFLPIILKFQSRFLLAKQVNDEVKLLLQVVIASLTMFFTAHLLAFKLHWPSRYTHHTFKMVLALAAAISITLILDTIFRWSRQNERQIFILGTIIILGAGLVFYPSSLKVFPKTPYVEGQVPALYEFLQKQPQNIVIASTSEEADNIPIFAKRTILVGKEYALPIHTKYYAQISRRMLDLINAQYSEDINQIKDFIQKYHVTFWLLERSAFTPEYITKNTWLQQYQPAAQQAKVNLQNNSLPVLATLINSCRVFETDNLVLLKTECIKAIKN